MIILSYCRGHRARSIFHELLNLTVRSSIDVYYKLISTDKHTIILHENNIIREYYVLSYTFTTHIFMPLFIIFLTTSLIIL